MGLNIKFYDDKHKEGELTSVGYIPVDTKARKDSKRLVTSGAVNEVEEKADAAAAALQDQIDEIAEKAGSGYIPKGEASVATLNGLSGQENGELYTMTDSGTLTDGSLAVVAGDTVAWDATNEVWYKAMDYAPRQYGTNEVHNLQTTITAFRTGDVIPVDGPSGTAKMSKDDLLKETAENALGSIHSLSDTATEDDLGATNYFAIDGAEGKKKFSADLVIAGDGSRHILSNYFRQWGSGRLLSNEFSAKKGDAFGFSGGVEGLTCKILALRGSTYVELIGDSQNFEYELSQDDKIYIDLRKDGLTVQNYDEEWITFFHSISSRAIDRKLGSDDAERIYAFKDGADYIHVGAFHYQSAFGRILSNAFSFKNGDQVVFDGSTSNGFCYILRRETPTSGSYITIASGTSFSHKFTQDENAIFFNIKNADDETPFNLTDYVEGSLIVYNVMSAKSIEELFGKVADPDFFTGPYEAKDGLFTLNINQFVQSGAKILSKSALNFERDMQVVFDGTADGTFGYILRRETPTSGSYITIASGTSFSHKFTQDENAIFFNIKNADGSNLDLDDFNPKTYKLYSKINTLRIEAIEEKVDSVEPNAIPYYSHVKNGKLVAGRVVSAGNWATYLACEMPDTCNYVGCKWYWEGSLATKGTIALAVMPNTWNKKISGNDGITGKCLHLTVTPSRLKVDFLGNAWGEYYYTNLINETLNLDVSHSVEHSLSLAIMGESVVVKLDGVTYTGTNSSDKSMTDVTGKYCFVEHFASLNDPSVVDMPSFTAFRVNDDESNVLFDAFQRENGVPTMSPQGFKYISLSNDSRFGEGNTNSYPNW